ncbi:MAG: D-glycerate dehydrogenase [Dehalococcoidia bacterium]|jgi:glyoxylate reductase|nr:D-glycerate dehydrogenase [Dehalococcoidia bacterium]MDP7627045.1 D-glycerate dehydrogenase [SAR202 cluster bacterium]MEC9278407.1 D-glycerate dehydrogenase [Chloroflexota bacterium]|tara:strand:+ start:1409 stop:2377 length:969 start_codon:yes stop_codon:yes gene_type:complete
MKIYVTRVIVPDAIERLQNEFEVEVWEEPTPPPKELMIEKVRECDGMMIESNDVMDSEVFAAAEKLKVVGTRAIGYDNIDINAATAKGVAIGNTPGILHESCADFTMGLILSLARQVSRSNRKVIAGEWKIFDQTPYLGTDVYGKTLGLIGLGLIGTAVAKRATGFDMDILYFSRTRKPELEDEFGVIWTPELKDLLVRSDYVSVHVPLGPDTQGFIGESELAAMKPEAFLINTSRGGTVDPDALRKALLEGRIAGAALDVTSPEPISKDDPLVFMENVLITPHIASASAATLRRMGLMAADNVIARLRGEKMPACLNPEAI